MNMDVKNHTTLAMKLHVKEKGTLYINLFIT